jgi:hypothetical protein
VGIHEKSDHVCSKSFLHLARPVLAAAWSGLQSLSNDGDLRDKEADNSIEIRTVKAASMKSSPLVKLPFFGDGTQSSKYA